MPSKYFTDDEMRCHCCGGLPEGGIDPKLFELLDEMREKLGPINVNCAYRCPSHNLAVGGIPDSQHVTGQAADLDATNYGVENMAEVAESCGADGVGRYPEDLFVHADVRSGKVSDTFRWNG